MTESRQVITSVLIGRDSEVQRLRQALDHTWQGRGQVVIIAGEAGIGKTRLLEELATDAVKRGGRALPGRCYESMQILPFGPWVDALRSGQVFDRGLVDTRAPTWRAEPASRRRATTICASSRAWRSSSSNWSPPSRCC